MKFLEKIKMFFAKKPQRRLVKKKNIYNNKL